MMVRTATAIVSALLALAPTLAPGAESPAQGGVPGDAIRSALGASLSPFAPLGPLSAPPRAADLDLGLSPPDQDAETALKHILAAEKLAADGRFVDAAARFHEIITAHGDAVVPVTRDVYMPAWRYCTARLLFSLPDVLRSYRASYAEAAQRALDSARAGRDSRLLLAVARLYGATPAALTALELLGADALEHGRAATAARFLLTRIALDRTAARYESSLAAKLALALARAGLREPLDRLARSLHVTARDEAVTVAGRAMLLVDYVDSLLRDCGSAVASSGGMAERAVRPGTLVWQSRLSGPSLLPRDYGLRDRAGDRLEPMVSAAASGAGVLCCQTPDEVRGFDAATGRTLWRIRTRVDSLNPIAWRRVPVPDAGGADDWLPIGVGALTPAVVGDSVLYSFPFVGSVPMGRWRGSALFGRLEAVPLVPSGEPGATVWSVNTRAGTDGEEPGGRSGSMRFTTPPVPVGDAVCVGARPAAGENESFLLAYDRADGRFLWRAPAASGATAGPLRVEIPSGAPPAAHEGVAYFCSDLGVVVAVDSADGSLLWAARYERDADAVWPLGRADDRAVTSNAPPNAPIAAGDALFILPADSRNVYAFDPATGALKWRVPREENGHVLLHLLGVDGGRVYLSGTSVACLDAKSGRLLWRSERWDAAPLGRPAAARDCILCPTERGIAAVDVAAAGKKTEWFTWAGCVGKPGGASPVGPGNLTMLDGRLVVVQNDLISVLLPTDAERTLRECANADRSAVRELVELGVLHLRAGRLKECRDSAREALARLGGPKAPGWRADSARELLVDACERLAADATQRGSPAEAAAALGEALDVSAAAALAVRRALALERAGSVKDALDALHGLLQRSPEVPVRVPAETLDGARGLTLRADILTGMLVAGMVERDGKEVYARFEVAARKSAGETGAPGAVEAAVLRLYPNSEAAADARLRRADESVRDARFGAACADLALVERLKPGYRAADVAALRKRLRDGRNALAAAPGTGNAPDAGKAKLLDVVWRDPLVPAIGEESIADGAAGGAGSYAGEHLLVAAGKSLQAYAFQSGRLAWESGTGFLGISFGDAGVSPARMPRPAIEIMEVLPDHAAERAGMKVGDMLLSFDGSRIRQKNDLVQLCATTRPGKPVELVVLRNGRPMTLRTVLGARPPEVRQAGVISPVSPRDYIRVFGLDGDTLLAETDLALLWIDRATGRAVARSIIDTPTQSDVPNRFGWVRDVLARGLRPVTAGGMAVASSPTNRLAAFDLAEPGTPPRWTVQLPGYTLLQMAAAGDKVAALASSGSAADRGVKATVFLFDSFSGQERMRVEEDAVMTQPEALTLTPTGENQVVAALHDRLVAYDTDACRKLWTVKAGDYEDVFHFSDVTACAGRVLVRAAAWGLMAFDAGSGRLVWKQKTAGDFCRLAVSENLALVFQATENRLSVAAYQLADGKRLWETRLAPNLEFHSAADRIPVAAVAGDRLFFVLQPAQAIRESVAVETSVGAVRLADGKLLRSVGLGKQAGYNVYGGRTHGGILGLITGSGLIGLSTVGE